MTFSFRRAFRKMLSVLSLILLSVVLLSVVAGAQNPAQIHAQKQTPSSKPHYVGSEACKNCHLSQFNSWKKSRMANILLDPKQHPEAVVGDFKDPDPVRTFTLDDVAFTYGGRFKQRYFAKRGDDYFPLPAQWDVAKQKWLPYHVEAGTDWWVPYYGTTNFDRPTGPTCDGCHSVNYDVHTKRVTEWNVGCEKCHGPGSAHVAHATKANIVNPGRLDFVRANDVCIQCHSQGRPLHNPIEGKYYDWPVGFTAGERLADYWQLEETKPGTTNFFQYADLTSHKNRMQGNDFVQSNMYHREIRCFDCHEVHSSAVSNLPVSGNALCLGCHSKQNPAGLRGTVSEHTHHDAKSTGSQCTACHMPRIEQTIKDNYVAAHTFRFITPDDTVQSGIPNPCTSCHKDKSNEWARQELAKWITTSPWRVAR